MASGAQLQRINGTGWRIGFGNLLRKENSDWLSVRSFLIQAAIWLAIINGVVAAVLWTVPQMAAEAREAGLAMTPAQAVPEALQVFFIMGAMATGVGAIIGMQGAIMDEKLSGTLEWLLSKPIARPAVILSKFLANALGALVIMVLLQGAVAYLQFRLAGGSVDLLAFGGGLAILYLYILFYLALTLLLGVVFKSRGGVIGLPLLLVFGYQIVNGIAPEVVTYTPWALTMPVGGGLTGMAGAVAAGGSLSTPLPIIITAILIVAMLGLAIWRFEKAEF
jgi:ABC-2 type transport system permease protein